MQTPELRENQRQILRSLVKRVDDETRVVSGEEIASDLGRNPGTIRNQIQSLRALQLVEGIPGVKGGYKPTAAAYRALDNERMDDPAAVPVEGDDAALGSITIEKIDFEMVHNPDLCRASVTVQEPAAAFSRGDAVTIGPTPSTGLKISGTVETIEPGSDTVTLSVDRMRTPTDPITAD